MRLVVSFLSHVLMENPLVHYMIALVWHFELARKLAKYQNCLDVNTSEVFSVHRMLVKNYSIVSQENC